MTAPLPPGPPPRHANTVTVDECLSFGDRIDVRSPAEFAEDHVPGAVNLPVLDDDERALVGTMYVKVSAFDARKAGAAIVARNIARIVETHVRDKPREWTPLVYCWRGGQRSRALVHVLGEIGFRATQLDGGYRAYRRHVVALLAQWPRQFAYRVICGLTGSGKSRLIEAIAAEGGQVLDLERLARHRGSLLGDIPGEPQPTQKAFESALFDAFDAPRCVASRVCRIGKPAHRPVAGARGAARFDARRAVHPARRRAAAARRDARGRLRASRARRDAAACAARTAREAPRQRRHCPVGSDDAVGADRRSSRRSFSTGTTIRRTSARCCAISALYRSAAVLRVDDARPAAFRELARQLLERTAAPRAA